MDVQLLIIISIITLRFPAGERGVSLSIKSHMIMRIVIVIVIALVILSACVSVRYAYISEVILPMEVKQLELIVQDQVGLAVTKNLVQYARMVT